MKKSIKWFSLIIAMWLVIIISLLAFTILEYIVPFSRDIKWIENSSKAYYQANSWIEEWLYKIFERNYWWWISDDTYEFSKIFSWVISSMYSTTSTWNILPPVWEWNSEYDKNWNVISTWNPLQLSIWNNYITSLSNFYVSFRVPNIDWGSQETLSWWTTLPVVNWQLSTINNTLNSSWSIIKANQVDWSSILLGWLQWVDLDWNETLSQQFWNFYNSNCWFGSGCVLKFSVVNKLETDSFSDSKLLPYLEWKIVLDSSNKIPLSHTKLESSGKSYGFKKDITIKVPAPSINEAFDFTVFQ